MLKTFQVLKKTGSCPVEIHKITSILHKLTSGKPPRKPSACTFACEAHGHTGSTQGASARGGSEVLPQGRFLSCSKKLRVLVCFDALFERIEQDATPASRRAAGQHVDHVTRLQ